MTDVAQEAMEALLVLHRPEKIEMWNPEAPINTFWDVSSQVNSDCRHNIYWIGLKSDLYSSLLCFRSCFLYRKN